MSAKYIYNIEELGFTSLDWEKDYGNYICRKCGEQRRSTRQAILKWQKQGTRFCSFCRNSPGMQKPISYYQQFVPENYEIVKVIPAAGNTKILVRKPCGHEDTYSSRHIISRETSQLACSICKTGGDYASLIEKEITEFVVNTFPELEVHTQIPYNSLIQTNRRFVQDLYLPKYKQVIEITTRSNGFAGYFEVIEQKRIILENTGYMFFIVYDTDMVYDIVKSLLKDKEV